MDGAVAFILKGYPRLSETFIAQEIRALEQRGLKLRICSLRHPTERVRHPIHDEIAAPVTYLPEYLHQEPWRVLKAWWRARRLAGYRRARAIWLRDLKRDRTPNRGRRFGQALVLATELATDVRHLHAHFIHTPTSVARYAALMRGLPFSISAHAKDIWTSPDWEKREKLADATFAVTCTQANADHLATLAPEGRVELIYHGLDLARFPPAPATHAERDGRDPSAPVILLSVGRAVEKKGYDDLLDALARLPQNLAWRFIHVGGGPLLPGLKERAAALGIEARIEWRGAQPQTVVLNTLRAVDLFVLASRRAADGDQDGLPNVLLEALSQGRAVLATRFSAVPELIEDDVTGRLVPPADPVALAVALQTMISDPALRARLGAAGLERLRERFALDACIALLARRFGV
ncbi:MAG: glycosyltransferase family 4 protein [Alphaproteobacteria bacterium]|nr:glycosyltransferase family 4 protein [Alphaproteobacteria bacterium]